MKKNLLILFPLILLLAACSRFGTDNTPTPAALPSFKPTAVLTKQWDANVGGVNEDNYLRFAIALDQNHLFTTDDEGMVTAREANTGKRLWRKDLSTSTTSGVAAGNGLVLVMDNKAELYALNAQKGNVLWQVTLPNQALAVPTIGTNIILVKTVDDQVIALDASTGKTRWVFASGTPQLILRFGSSPVITGDKVLVGSASGKLFLLTLADGTILWEQPIAIPNGATEVQQMVDIDLNPVVVKGMVYVATYQGNIAALQLSTGVMSWHKEFSSFTGIALAGEQLFATDANSHLWLFRTSDGVVQWKQDKLEHRNVTAPALTDNYVAVADGLGYLHVLSRSTGEFAAQAKVSDDAIIAAPITQGNTIYVLTRSGKLAAYSIK
jgi:outer membrane protein assembly factor BamB